MSNSYFDNGRMMDRREFVKVTSAAAAGTMLMGWLPKGTEAVEKYPHWGEVVVVRNDAATDGPDIHAEEVQAMLDESVKQLTNTSSVSDAWAALLLGWKEDHVIAIRVNAMVKEIPTHPEVVDAIVAGLTEMGVPKNNIIVYDRRYKYSESNGLAAVGYTYNTGPVGVRYFDTDEDGWGCDREHPVNIVGQTKVLSTILTRCDHLINVPVLKVHLDQYGVTLSLKNHYGSVDKPWELHNNFATACAELNAQEAIKSKTRLIVTDALFGCWGSNPAAWVLDYAPNSLIVSTDPVAADCIGTEILDEERAKHDKPPRKVPLLKKAAEIGLGARVHEIQKISLCLGSK